MTYSKMACRKAKKICLVTLFLFCTPLISGRFGKAEEESPHVGSGIHDHEDPTQIVDRALICFNEKHIYSSCNDAYRLSASGNLHVPADHVDDFCNGPCLTETNIVLHCIENVFENFEFFNSATIQDVRETVKAGCGHGIDRGNFDVAEHIQAEENKSQKLYIPLMLVILSTVLAHMQLLL